ncbi:hypothetical protein COOONC_11659 [Cooperia oncophora]
MISCFRYCHGTCASYFIPRLNSKKLKAVFKSCAALRASRLRCRQCHIGLPWTRSATNYQVHCEDQKVRMHRSGPVGASSLIADEIIAF